MKLVELIGQTLREKITEQGYNYSTYAEKVGFTQGYISQIVNGNAKKLPIETLEKLVIALEMTISDFWAEVEKKKTSQGVSFSRAELEEILQAMPNGDTKKGVLRRLRERLPDVPEWLKTENHIKYVQNLPDKPLIEGIAANNREQYGNSEQPQEG